MRLSDGAVGFGRRASLWLGDSAARKQSRKTELLVLIASRPLGHVQPASTIIRDQAHKKTRHRAQIRAMLAASRPKSRTRSDTDTALLAAGSSMSPETKAASAVAMAAAVASISSASPGLQESGQAWQHLTVFRHSYDLAWG